MTFRLRWLTIILLPLSSSQQFAYSADGGGDCCAGLFVGRWVALVRLVDGRIDLWNAIDEVLRVGHCLFALLDRRVAFRGGWPLPQEVEVGCQSGEVLVIFESVSEQFQANRADRGFSRSSEVAHEHARPTAPPVQDSSGAWRRPYSQGETIVNSSPTASAVVSVPSGTWHDLDGQRIVRPTQITLAPVPC